MPSFALRKLDEGPKPGLQVGLQALPWPWPWD
jgi:hypothetical protein